MEILTEHLAAGQKRSNDFLHREICVTRNGQKGFSLIELMITLVVIGLIAAIAIPNLLNAINRGKQKRTMADMRSIATAVEAYSVDNTVYPTASDGGSLATSIQPVYIDNLPLLDGWNNAYIVESDALRYTLGSGGKDGGAVNYVGGPTTDFNDAIVFSNGRFAQWPEGAQN